MSYKKAMITAAAIALLCGTVEARPPTPYDRCSSALYDLWTLPEDFNPHEDRLLREILVHACSQLTEEQFEQVVQTTRERIKRAERVREQL